MPTLLLRDGHVRGTVAFGVLPSWPGRGVGDRGVLGAYAPGGVEAHGAIVHMNRKQ